MRPANDQLLAFYSSAFELALDLAFVCVYGSGHSHDQKSVVSKEVQLGNADASEQMQVISGIETRHFNPADSAYLPIPWMMAYWSGLCEAACQRHTAWLSNTQANVRDSDMRNTTNASAPDEMVRLHEPSREGAQSWSRT